MKHANALGKVQALVGLGLPPEAFVPALLEALHGLIPSDRNLFDWTDASGQLLRYFFEGPVDHEINRHYFEVFHNRAEPAAMPSYQQALTGRAVVLGAAALDQPAFYRSAYYNEIWRPQGLHTRIEAIIRSDCGTPLGSLVLYRAPGERKFSRRDEALLAQLVPYVARGLQAGAPSEAARYRPKPGDTASVCLAADGRIAQLSEHAHRLLLLAHGDITPAAAARAPALDGFAALDALWRQWQGPTRRASRIERQNAWGRFSFEPCELRPAEGRGAALLLVSLCHHELELLALRRAVDSFGLSAAQGSVCLLLHAGHTQAEIARRLGVAPSTVVDHVRKIYARLDVHSAGELLLALNQRLQPH